jgi:hypothetical protein
VVSSLSVSLSLSLGTVVSSACHDSRVCGALLMCGEGGPSTGHLGLEHGHGGEGLGRMCQRAAASCVMVLVSDIVPPGAVSAPVKILVDSQVPFAGV